MNTPRINPTQIADASQKKTFKGVLVDADGIQTECQFTAGDIVQSAIAELSFEERLSLLGFSLQPNGDFVLTTPSSVRVFTPTNS